MTSLLRFVHPHLQLVSNPANPAPQPVNFNWLEKKVTEWGCMQALLDFDGWKAWKEDPENVRLRHLERENKKTGKGKRLLQNKKNTPKIGAAGQST